MLAGRQPRRPGPARRPRRRIVPGRGRGQLRQRIGAAGVGATSGHRARVTPSERQVESVTSASAAAVDAKPGTAAGSVVTSRPVAAALARFIAMANAAQDGAPILPITPTAPAKHPTGTRLGGTWRATTPARRQRRSRWSRRARSPSRRPAWSYAPSTRIRPTRPGPNRESSWGTRSPAAVWSVEPGARSTRSAAVLRSVRPARTRPPAVVGAVRVQTGWS